MREEMGPDFDDIDWKKLDPRQYDPRRIIREALIEDDEPVVKVRKPVEGAYARQQREKAEAAAAGVTAAPYDTEST
jgi:sec-independent protein translocase protein TatB